MVSAMRVAEAATEGRPPLQGHQMRIEGNRRAQLMNSKGMGGKNRGAENVQPNGRFDTSGGMFAMGQGAEEGKHAKPEAGAINLRMR